MYVVGTAGHVDHGKSTLIQALTGIDPDRLREEKERGLTIDLGFAWMTLPSGREISIVDVPGHERFIKNMLAGAGGIDAALLVIAADESVMPQTREHLAILDLLHVQRALAVITKRDLVDADLLDLVQMDVEDVLRGTSLEGASILAVSSTTGEGLEELAAAIDELLDETAQRKDVGRPRLAIDRAFTMAGFGTVVTGTLIDGTLQVGQEVELVPSRKRGRIRGIQSHRKKEEQALPGTRTAVNISGISTDDVARGDVLTIPRWLKPTRAIDARLHALSDAPHSVRHNLPVTLHVHSTEAQAKVRLLEENELQPGAGGWAQIWLEDPTPIVRGDYFVIRSADATLGGGVVVEVDAVRHRRRNPKTLARLETLAEGSPSARLVSALEAGEPADVATLAKRANITAIEAEELALQAIADGDAVALGKPSADGVLYTAAGWARLSGKAQQALVAFHAQQPLRTGMTREELRSRLGLASGVAQPAIQHMIDTGAIVDEGPRVRLPEHTLTINAEQRAAMDAYLQRLAADPFSSDAPSLDPNLLALLADEGHIVRAGNSIVFERATYDGIAERIVAHIREHGNATLADVRDLLGTSRKYAQALLEHLDDEKITRRQGDERVLLRQ